MSAPGPEANLSGSSISPPGSDRVPAHRYRWAGIRAWTLLLAGFALTNTASAQAGASLSASTDPFYRHRPLVEGDSLEVLRAVRSRQFAFERMRRSTFPQAESRRRVECDDLIGRFCYTHISEEYEPHPESEDVTRARLALIAALDTAAGWQPTDTWIAAQRVRYLVEIKEYQRALAVVDDCQLFQEWWCFAFAGYIEHQRGGWEVAQPLFDRALEIMPREDRCAWNDLSPLLPDEMAERYSQLSCDDRTSQNRRIWWLADPLFMVPGNDRRTEHYARQVTNKILEQSESGYGVYWSPDMGRMIARYGWPVDWERVEVGRSERFQEEAIISRHPFNAKTFVPDARTINDPFSAEWIEWDLDNPEARSRYAAPYALHFDDLREHQVAVFLRGDEALVVGAFEWRDSTGSMRSGYESALAATPSAALPTTLSVSDTSSLRQAMTLTTPAVPTIIGLEALDRTNKRAGRIRFGIYPPELTADGISVSAPLLFREIDPLPVNLDTILPLMLPSNHLDPGISVGVYWEVYGEFAEDDSLSISVGVYKDGRNVRRGSGSQAGASINWVAPTGEPAAARPGSVGLRIGDLESGEYTLRIEIADGRGRRARGERKIVVR